MSDGLFVLGFSITESTRIQDFFSKLIPYLDLNQTVVVGGLAIRQYVVRHLCTYPVRGFNDLDLLVKDLHVVSPKITDDFFVYHYHQPDGINLLTLLQDTLYCLLVF